jgi:putative ABC transport system permease protein
MIPKPPPLASKFLKWFCAPNLYESIQGDLEEEFGFQVKKVGEQKAILYYWWEVLGFVRLTYIRRRETVNTSVHLFSPAMIRNYFKIAFRTLLRDKSYAFINITGLALGLAACIVIFLVVQNELSYDHFHKKADRIYRVTIHGKDYNPSVSFAIAPAFKNDFPEAEVSQYFYQQNGYVKVGEQKYNEKGYAFADNNFPRLFDFIWLAGNPNTALKEPNTVVLTESQAKKYFRDDDAIGKTIRLDNQHDLRITGIIKDLPSNSHLLFSFLVSWETIRKDVVTPQFWSIQGGFLYVALPEKVSLKSVEARLPAFIRKNWGEEISREKGVLLLQPLKEIHFDRRYITQISMPRSRETIYGLGGVALFIVLTACINFINLATAQSLKRGKEVGIRKTLGAFRKQLILQVLGETTLLVIISVVLALLSVFLFIPYAKSLLDIKIEPGSLFKPQVIGMVSVITIITILVSGLYPAFIQSGFQPIKALKSGVADQTNGNSYLRKGLVIVQFSITQILLVGTLVVGSQMDFFLNQNMGFDKDAIVTFPTGEKKDVLRQKLLDNRGIEKVSFASGGPAYSNNFAPFSSPATGMTETDVTEIKQVDENYLSMYNLKMIAGEPVTKIISKDTIVSLVVNQTLIKRMGVKEPEKAIGMRILIGDTPVRIKGVVKDFQSESKHNKIRACIIMYNPNSFWQASVKLRPEKMRETLASIEKDWLELNPESLFTYEFMDQHIAGMYQQEEKMYNAFRLFSAIAILIGCLGLYGLVSLMAVQRTKEIGIRKVMGASVPGIVVLFIKQFIWLILIAFLAAAPIAWFVMEKWLQEFAYHIKVGPGIFLITILTTFILAGMTISYQSIKAAVANPLKSLKSE